MPGSARSPEPPHARTALTSTPCSHVDALRSRLTPRPCAHADALRSRRRIELKPTLCAQALPDALRARRRTARTQTLCAHALPHALCENTRTCVLTASQFLNALRVCAGAPARLSRSCLLLQALYARRCPAHTRCPAHSAHACARMCGQIGRQLLGALCVFADAPARRSPPFHLFELSLALASVDETCPLFHLVPATYCRRSSVASATSYSTPRTGDFVLCSPPVRDPLLPAAWCCCSHQLA